MSEVAEKHLRGKLKEYQEWFEKEIDLGHIDLEKTPEPFDRKLYLLNKEAANNHTIGSHCHLCNKKFESGEEKVTSNRIMFFHSDCKPKFEKAEEQALNRQDKY